MSTEEHDPKSADEEPKLVVSLSLYITASCIIPMFISAGINALLVLGLYGGAKAKKVAVWAFPDPLGGDIIITTVMTAILTRLASAQIAMHDLITGHPLRVISNIMSVESFANTDKKRDMSPFQAVFFHESFSVGHIMLLSDRTCCQKFAHEILAGFLIGCFWAILGGFPLAMILFGVRGNAAGIWSFKELMIIKVVYGGIIELPIVMFVLWTLVRQLTGQDLSCMSKAPPQSMAQTGVTRSPQNVTVDVENE